MIIALDGLSGATTAGRLELVGVVGRGLGVFEREVSKNRGAFWPIPPTLVAVSRGGPFGNRWSGLGFSRLPKGILGGEGVDLTSDRLGTSGPAEVGRRRAPMEVG